MKERTKKLNLLPILKIIFQEIQKLQGGYFDMVPSLKKMILGVVKSINETPADQIEFDAQAKSDDNAFMYICGIVSSNNYTRILVNENMHIDLVTKKYELAQIENINSTLLELLEVYCNKMTEYNNNGGDIDLLQKNEKGMGYIIYAKMTGKELFFQDVSMKVAGYKIAKIQEALVHLGGEVEEQNDAGD